MAAPKLMGGYYYIITYKYIRFWKITNNKKTDGNERFRYL